jgi:micrococcal nuclease
MYEYKCDVKRIVDGDTVDVIIDLGFSIFYSTRVRLYGIDTPESRTRNKDEKVRGLLSKDYLKEWLDQGGVVIRTYRDKRGKFGRVLGEMVVGGRNINLLMVDENLAVKYEGQSKDDIKKEHKVNRDKLIEKGLFNPDEV